MISPALLSFGAKMAEPAEMLLLLLLLYCYFKVWMRIKDFDISMKDKVSYDDLDDIIEDRIDKRLELIEFKLNGIKSNLDSIIETKIKL